jgi:hypothetical protein
LLLALSSAVNAVSLCFASHFQPSDGFGATFDAWVAPTYTVLGDDENLVLLGNDSGNYRGALIRARTAKKKGGAPTPIVSYRAVPAALATRAIASASKVLHRTRYLETPCTEFYIHGNLIEAKASMRGAGTYAGEVYVPIDQLETGAMKALGRILRTYIEGQATIEQLEASIVALEAHGVEKKNLSAN